MPTERRAARYLVLANLLALGLWGGAANASTTTTTLPGNVWVLGSQGEVKQAYQVGPGGGTWTEQATAQGASQAKIFFSGGNRLLPRAAGDVFLVNQAQKSLPPLHSTIPQVSLVGLGAALSDAGDPTKPGIGIAPESGSFTGTVAVILTGVQGTGGTGTFSLHWKIGAGPVQSVGGTQHVFHLVQEGVHQVEAWAMHGSATSAHKTKIYTITSDHPDGFRRDSDGDGLPDLWEAAHGFDPLSNDIGRDSDGDGWTDFEELIRGADPNDPDDVPVDSDLDGWSDYDETVRGTNPNDRLGTLFPDRPVATRLTEVEHLIEGPAPPPGPGQCPAIPGPSIVYDDAAETTPKTDMGELTVLDVLWNTRYDQATLPSAADLASFKLTEADIPAHLRASDAAAALACGNIPNLRLPAGEPLIVRAAHLDGGTGDCWVARDWLDSAADVTPAGVTAYLAGLATPWTTPAEWQAGYTAYLMATLVQDTTATLSPRSGRGVSLVEGLVAWYADLGAGAVVLLGEPAPIQPVDAVAALRAAIGEARVDENGVVLQAARSLDELHAELAAIAAPGEALAAFATAVDTAFGSCSRVCVGGPNDAQPCSTDTDCPAGLCPPLTTSTEAAALVQGAGADPLVIYVSRLYTVVGQEYLDALTTPELAALLDPDGDFDADTVANDGELGATPAETSDPTATDTDGDSQPDAADPCPRDAGDVCSQTTAQLGDTDGDGWANWVDNCPDDPNPDQADADGDGFGDVCDPGSLLTASADGPYVAAEGDPVHMAVSAESADGTSATPEHVQWRFGDRTPARSGTATMHVYAQQGIYDVTVTVVDDAGTTARDATTAAIADTAPAPDFDHGPGIEPLEVVFTDLSTAHDGIVSRSWDFGDGTTGSAERNPVHVFPAANVYQVTLTTVDGDGTVASISRQVAVGIESIPALSPWSIAVLVTLLATAIRGLAFRSRARGAAGRTRR